MRYRSLVSIFDRRLVLAASLLLAGGCALLPGRSAETASVTRSPTTTAARRDPPARSSAAAAPRTSGSAATRNGSSAAGPSAEREESPPVARRTREIVPLTPRATSPKNVESIVMRRRALNSRGLRIVVSTEDRALWLLRDTTVVFRAPVAVGRDAPFSYGGKRYDFRTPVGQRKVLAKGLNPIWNPPDWHYFEKLVEHQLKPVLMKPGMRVRLSDSTYIEMRGDQVGRVNRFGNFAPFNPANEIIFDGKLFIPPFGSAQRRVPGVLGTHKLELADGYLIHGTNEVDSIGEPVSHGCVRMYNEDVSRLYALVPVGTPVFIY
jgi:hypothetical protein